MQPCGILLCAGAGTRFGGGKIAHRLADGTPVGVASARRFAQALKKVICVARPGDEAVIAPLRQAGFEVVECPEASRGMGHSLVCGVRASREANGWVVGLGDMPGIAERSIRAVAQAIADGALLAAAFHNGERGHPVGFAASLRDELLVLEGDAGARDVVRRHAGELVQVAVDDAGVLLDIDRPEDLARFDPG